MLSFCANPDCGAEFLYLHEGEVFSSSCQTRASSTTGSVPQAHLICAWCMTRLEERES
jgi:hypothetical protein